MTNCKMTNSEAMNIDNMLRKIAKRKSHQYSTLSSRLNMEDVVQELWIKALDIFNRFPEMPFEDKRRMVAKAAYDKIVDIIRFECRRPSIAIDPTRFERNAEEEEVADASQSYISISDLNSNINSQLDVVEVKEILNLFKEGSKHRRYVELAMSYFCNLGEEFFNENEDYTLMQGSQENYWNSWIAKQLGFAGASSSGYQKVRNYVRAKLVQCGYADKYPETFEKFSTWDPVDV